MFAKTIGIVRLAMILKALKVENHFECSEDTVQTIVGYILVSDLSNKEIQKEILEGHTFQQLVAEVMRGEAA